MEDYEVFEEPNETGNPSDSAADDTADNTEGGEVIDEPIDQSDTSPGGDLGGEDGAEEADGSAPVLTEEQLADALRALLMESSEGEEDDGEQQELLLDGEDGGSDSVGGVASDGDYGEVLGQILLELQTANASGLPMTAENIYTEIGDQIAADSVETHLNDLSATNVLLCGVFLLLLVNIAIKFGKGVLS